MASNRPKRLRSGAAPRPLGLPDLGIGIGLRTAHYSEILQADRSQSVRDSAAHSPSAAMPRWFEVITDNFLDTAGRPLEVLDQIAARFPVVLHGVSLSIGSSDPLDLAYVRAVAALRDRVGARWVSDHLCWTGVNGKNSHDLLPMPYTPESMRLCRDRVDAVQQLWGQPLILENPSSYVGFRHSTMGEAEFLASLCVATGCGLLLDVNNVYVSACNHGFSALEYLETIPMERVVQVHVAGHSQQGNLVVDTHIGPVIDPVWGLLRAAWERGCRGSVLLEWDAEIPPLATVVAEANKAADWMTTLSESPAPGAQISSAARHDPSAR